jgi:hypothetical protein
MAGPLRSADITPLHRCYGPNRHPLVFGRLPGFAGYTAYLAPTISRRNSEDDVSDIALLWIGIFLPLPRTQFRTMHSASIRERPRGRKRREFHVDVQRRGWTRRGTKPQPDHQDRDEGLNMRTLPTCFSQNMRTNAARTTYAEKLSTWI